MIIGLHILAFSTDPAADRAFLRDVLGWPYVEDADSEPGWLIFKTPVTELGVHPAEAPAGADLFLMCDDIGATVRELAAKGVDTTPVQERGFGLVTNLTLPSGATLGMYQPKHPLAVTL